MKCSMTGNWIQTFTGRQFYPHAPTFHLEDMAHALAHQCRFAGHTREHYSVAQHSVLLHDYARFTLRASEQDCISALFHDGGEAYLVDIPSPIKALLPDYKRMEAAIDAALAKWVGLEVLKTPLVAELDLRILLDEREAFLKTFQRPPWAPEIEALRPLGLPPLKSWTAGESKREWLERALRYKGIQEDS